MNRRRLQLALSAGAIAILTLCLGYHQLTHPQAGPAEQALIEANRIDYSMQLYYQEEGAWPTSVASLAYSGKMLVNPNKHHETLNWQLHVHGEQVFVQAPSKLSPAACDKFNKHPQRPAHITCKVHKPVPVLQVDLVASASERIASRTEQ